MSSTGTDHTTVPAQPPSPAEQSVSPEQLATAGPQAVTEPVTEPSAVIEPPAVTEPAEAPEQLAAPPAEAATPAKLRLEVLDFIRFLAAAYVVIFHFSAGDRGSWQKPSHELFQPLFSVAAYGWLGVQLFFMISGFVICMSAWGKSQTQFLISRVVRLYPAYWFAVLLTTAVLLLDQSRARALPWTQVLVNMTMMEKFAKVAWVDPSYWTLSLELVFYAFIALTLVWWGFTYNRVIVFCVVWLVISLFEGGTGSYVITLIFLPIYAPFFVSGMVMYLIHRFGPSLRLWALLACAYGVSLHQLGSRTLGQKPSGAHLNNGVTIAIVTGFFVILTLIALGKLNMIRGRWLVTAGALTYPLYLLHQQIGETIIESLDHHIPPWVLMWGTFAFMLALAYVVQRWVERPVARRTRIILYAAVDAIRGTAQRLRRVES